MTLRGVDIGDICTVHGTFFCGTSCCVLYLVCASLTIHCEHNHLILLGWRTNFRTLILSFLSPDAATDPISEAKLVRFCLSVSVSRGQQKASFLGIQTLCREPDCSTMLRPAETAVGQGYFPLMFALNTYQFLCYWPRWRLTALLTRVAATGIRCARKPVTKNYA